MIRSEPNEMASRTATLIRVAAAALPYSKFSCADWKM
jgi:hypothetical protein